MVLLKYNITLFVLKNNWRFRACNGKCGYLILSVTVNLQVNGNLNQKSRVQEGKTFYAVLRRILSLIFLTFAIYSFSWIILMAIFYFIGRAIHLNLL